MRITFSLQALEDLDDLSFYIENKLQNPIAAHNTLSKILQRANMLRNFSDLGQRSEINDDFIQKYRLLTVNNYLVIYKVTDKEVIVVRVVYARSDYKKLLDN